MTSDPPRSGFFTSRRLKLHYVEWGDPNAPPLLLIHGARDHARSWDDIARAFAPRWRVIAPDLRGHGDSDWASGGYAIFDFVADLAALNDALGNMPLPIVAHSLGGNIALRYSALFPERVSRLVVIEGLTPLPASSSQTDAQADRLRCWLEKTARRASGERRGYSDVAMAATRMQALNPRLGDRLARHLVTHGTQKGEDGRLRFKFDPAALPLMPIDLTYDQKCLLWARITCPLLLVYGGQSWARNPADDGRIEAFSNANLALFEDAGHWVHQDRPDAFVAAVAAFLEPENRN